MNKPLKELNLLTPREREILDAFCHGQSHAAMARAFSIAPRTVVQHIANCKEKLGVFSSPALVALCVSEGIIRFSRKRINARSLNLEDWAEAKRWGI